MNALLVFIQNHAPYLIDYKYCFLFLGGMLEGMNSLVLAGFLSSVGAIKLYFIIPLLILAHGLNGYIWYAVGYFGGAKALDRWGHRNKISHQVIGRINDYFSRYSGRAILFAKFTFSLEIATMILSGSLKYNLKKFTKYNFLGSAGWVVMAVFVGYFFGRSFKLFSVLMKNFSLLLIFLTGAIVILYLIKIVIKSHYIRYLTLQQKIREWRDKIRHGIDDFFARHE